MIGNKSLWLDKWAPTLASMAPNQNIRSQCKRWSNVTYDHEYFAELIFSSLLAEVDRNQDDQFCLSLADSILRHVRFHNERCTLSEWVFAFRNDPDFTRKSLQAKLADLEIEQKQTLLALKELGS